jgi:hypothetical protein
MITFQCPRCAQEYAVRPEFAGRRSKCRRCGEGVEVPQPPPPEQEEPLAVSDALLPAEYGADPLADGKASEVVDDGAERCQQGVPAEEDIPEVLPAPVDYLEVVEEIPDDPRSKKKKDVRLPVIHGIDAVVKIRGPNVVVDYDDYAPEKIHITTIARIEVTSSAFGGNGEIRFLIGTRHMGGAAYGHLLGDEIVDQVAVAIPASETRKAMAFKGMVEALKARLIQDYNLGR